MDIDVRDPKITDYGFQKQRQQEERRATNVISLGIFLLFTVIWSSIGLYVILNKKNDYPKDHEYLLKCIRLYVGWFIFITSLIILLMLCYAYLLKKMLTKFFVILGIIFNVIMVLAIPTFIIGNLIYIKEVMMIFTSLTPTELIFADAMLVFVTVYKVIAISAIIKVKLNFVTEIIKESCRAMFHFPTLIAFTLTFFFLGSVLLFYVLYKLESFEHNYYKSFTELYFHKFINLGFFFIINFFTYFVQTVISDCIATWYWTENKNEVRQVTTFKSIKRVIGAHLGTIAYASSYIFPLIQAILVLIKIKSNRSLTNRGPDNRLTSLMTRFYLTFDISDFALIHTSADGHDFYQSTKKTCVLALRHPSRFLAVLDTFAGVLSVSTSVVTFIVMYTIDRIFSHEEFANYPFAVFLCFMSLFILMPIYLLLCTSVRTIMMCTFEDLSENEGTLEKPYYMNQNLKCLLTN